ncbi:MAG: hypothetical protein HQ501_13705 [Rhodospirillales bacterium]|nr:hypothetical protein [Rhodospirillales bacterium]
MPREKVFAYAVIGALMGAFGLTAWLASESRFLEAISVMGVATTLAWFVTRALNRDGDGE